MSLVPDETYPMSPNLNPNPKTGHYCTWLLGESRDHAEGLDAEMTERAICASFWNVFLQPTCARLSCRCSLFDRMVKWFAGMICAQIVLLHFISCVLISFPLCPLDIQTILQQVRCWVCRLVRSLGVVRHALICLRWCPITLRRTGS